MLRPLGIALLTGLLLSGPVQTAAEDISAEDAYKYRESVMSALRHHIGAASMIVRGIIPDDGHLLYHAEALAGGAKEIHRVFQAGSAIEDSEALPVIWEQPEKFQEAIERAEAATAAFRDAVADGADSGAVSAAFRNMGMSCRGCHDDFRVPRD